MIKTIIPLPWLISHSCQGSDVKSFKNDPTLSDKCTKAAWAHLKELENCGQIFTYNYKRIFENDKSNMDLLKNDACCYLKQDDACLDILKVNHYDH